jgi:hypothetical protein
VGKKELIVIPGYIWSRKAAVQDVVERCFIRPLICQRCRFVWVGTKGDRYSLDRWLETLVVRSGNSGRATKTIPCPATHFQGPRPRNQTRPLSFLMLEPPNLYSLVCQLEMQKVSRFTLCRGGVESRARSNLWIRIEFKFFLRFSNLLGGK